MPVKQETKLTLRQWRRLRDLSQEKLAVDAGVTARTIGNYESDVRVLRKASYESLESIARALDITVDDIFLDDISEIPK